MKLITTLLFAFSLTALIAQNNALEIELSHNIDDVTGDDFEVQLSVSNFTDLLTFQLFLNWDERIYRINNVVFVNEDLPFFDSSIILPVDDNSIPDPGKVRIIWADAAPVTLADESVLVTFSFTALGQTCEISDFTLEDIGQEESEQLLVVDNNLNERDLDFDAVGIQIPGAACTSNTNDLSELIQVNTYPNPVIEDWHVEISPIGNTTQLYIYNNTGKLVQRETLTQSNNRIDLSELTEGIYLYQITDNNAIINHGKINKLK